MNQGRPLAELRSLRATCTYNDDDLLEKQVAPAGCFYSAASPEDAPPAGEVPVYHVHGLLPADRNEPPRGDIIFSEEDYHRVYHDPYHWSNTCQSDLFRSSATLFIGVSFSDPHLRRILSPLR